MPSRFSEKEIDEVVKVTGWPRDVLTDPKKQPIVVNTLEEFREWTFKRDFTDEAVVLTNGIKLLGLEYEKVFPNDIYDIFENLKRNTSVWSIIKSFSQEMFQTYQGKLCYMHKGKDDEPDFDYLNEQIDYVETNGHQKENLYLTEMRFRKKYKHPITGENTKTACKLDGKDVLGEQADFGTLYWDRYDTGIFIGNSGSGMGLHSDQVFWANLGKNWFGYKLLGLWKSGPTSVNLLKNHRHKIFAREPFGKLGAEELAAVRNVHRVCLLKPGETMVFSAAGAHMAISICPDQKLSIGAYESFIPYHDAHVKLFLETGNKEMHHSSFVMDSEDVYDIKDDMLDHIERVINIYHTLTPSRQEQFLHCLYTLRTNCRYFDRHIYMIIVELESTDKANKDSLKKIRVDSFELFRGQERLAPVKEESPKITETSFEKFENWGDWKKVAKQKIREKTEKEKAKQTGTEDLVLTPKKRSNAEDRKETKKVCTVHLDDVI